MNDNTSHNLAERLQRLEEDAGFSERTTDQLSGELHELSKAIIALDKRMKALEGRVEDLMNPAEHAGTGRSGESDSVTPE